MAFTDGERALANARVMRRALAYATGFDALIVQHPEEPALAEHGVMNEGQLASRLGLAGIPPAAETMMVERDLRLVELTGGRLHFAHVSTAGALAAIRAAKARGLRVTCDTAPHYLALNELEVEGYRTFAKVSPPLRSEDDRRAVVEALRDGTIDVIASDHCPQDQDSKRLPFAQAACGVIGVQTMLAVCLRLVHEGDLGLLALLAHHDRGAGADPGARCRAAGQGCPRRSRPVRPGRTLEGHREQPEEPVQEHGLRGAAGRGADRAHPGRRPRPSTSRRSEPRASVPGVLASVRHEGPREPMDQGNDFFKDRFIERVILLALLAFLVFAVHPDRQPVHRADAVGIIIAVATWHPYRRLSKALGDKRILAAVLVSLGLLLVLVVPISLLVDSLAEGVRGVAGLMRDLTTIRLPEPPAWIRDLPVVGMELDDQWRQAMVDLPASLAQLQPYIGTAAGYGLSIGAGLGFAIIEFLVAIVIAAILLVTGEAGVQVLRRFVARIGGAHHLSLLDVAAQTIRGVAAGIIFTAFLQAALLVLGLVVVGAPGPILLGFLTFFLLVLQLPNWLVWIPVVIWLGYKGRDRARHLPVHLGHLRRQHDRQFHPALPDQPGRAAAVAVDLRRRHRRPVRLRLHRPVRGRHAPRRRLHDLPQLAGRGAAAAGGDVLSRLAWSRMPGMLGRAAHREAGRWAKKWAEPAR